jgi:sulfate/thiosulfate transport system substrate-binding protein
VVDAKGTRKVAEAYLNFLYTPQAQKLIAHNYYRPSDPKSADSNDLARLFPSAMQTDIAFGLFSLTKTPAEAGALHFVWWQSALTLSSSSNTPAP